MLRKIVERLQALSLVARLSEELVDATYVLERGMCPGTAAAESSVVVAKEGIMSRYVQANLGKRHQKINNRNHLVQEGSTLKPPLSSYQKRDYYGRILVNLYFFKQQEPLHTIQTVRQPL